MTENLLNLSEAAGKALKSRRLTISAAESCTGGALLHTLTNTPGCSSYVIGGVVAYANAVKVEQLRVNEDDLQQYGAVSKSIALQMAKNIAGVMRTDIGISTTGIAGPAGGSDEKPVGTVWIGFWSANKHFALKENFGGNRLSIKKQTVEVALEIVRSQVSGHKSQVSKLNTRDS